MLVHSCHLLPPPKLNDFRPNNLSRTRTMFALKYGMAPGTTEFLWSGLERAIVPQISIRRERRHGTEILYSVIGRKDILWWCEPVLSCWCACCSNGFTPNERTRARTRSNRGFPDHLIHVALLNPSVNATCIHDHYLSLRPSKCYPIRTGIF